MTITIPDHTTTLYLNECPTGAINTTFGQPDSTFKKVTEPLRELKPGEVLVKNLIFSNDPIQRVWIQKDIPQDALYMPPIRENDPMQSFGVVQILKSNDSGYKPGDIATCTTYWGDNVIIPASLIFTKVIDFLGFPLHAYVDIIGITGLTAYYSLFKVHRLKKSDVLVVSGAAGATGSMVVQIAKNVIGAKKVIGIAGGPEKCDFVKSLGADECVDYKKPNFFENMKQALGEDKECDVYFDGVGGEILNHMLFLTKVHGTIISCGSVTGYNDDEKSYVKNWRSIAIKRLTVKGLLVSDFIEQSTMAVLYMWWWVKRGYIKYESDQVETVDLSKDPKALEHLPVTLNKLFNGQKKNGKLVTKLADPEKL